MAARAEGTARSGSVAGACPLEDSGDRGGWLVGSVWEGNGCEGVAVSKHFRVTSGRFRCVTSRTAGLVQCAAEPGYPRRRGETNVVVMSGQGDFPRIIVLTDDAGCPCVNALRTGEGASVRARAPASISRIVQPVAGGEGGNTPGDRGKEAAYQPSEAARRSVEWGSIGSVGKPRNGFALAVGMSWGRIATVGNVIELRLGVRRRRRGDDGVSRAGRNR